MKTGKEYFEMLSEVEKKLYEANIIARYGEKELILKLKFPSFNSFMRYSFVWEYTPEGHSYWKYIADRKGGVIPPTTPYKSGIMLGIFIGFFTGTLLTMATRDWTYQLLGMDLLIVAGIVYLYKKYREEQ